MKLTWGKGLPFSLEDIIVIERALSKRMLESQNNGLDEAQGFEQRIQLMEELEAQQWADREKVSVTFCSNSKFWQSVSNLH